MRRKQLLSNINILTVRPEWESLMEYIDTLIEANLLQLTTCTTWEQAKEIQGRVKAYKAIRTLKDTIAAAKHNGL